MSTTHSGYLKGETLDGGWWTLRVALTPSADVFYPHVEREITAGYYTDTYGNETIAPIVVRLSHGRLLAAWTMGEGMATSVDRSDVFTSERDAWIAAHHMAKRDAETEREYQASRCAECLDHEKRGYGELPDLCESCYQESDARTLAHHATE